MTPSTQTWHAVFSEGKPIAFFLDGIEAIQWSAQRPGSTVAKRRLTFGKTVGVYEEPTPRSDQAVRVRSIRPIVVPGACVNESAYINGWLAGYRSTGNENYNPYRLHGDDSAACWADGLKAGRAEALEDQQQEGASNA